MNRKSSGFTVLELLVVIAVISLLAGILFPVIASAKRIANGTVCISNLRQLAEATLIYSGDYDDLIPHAADPIVKGELNETPTCFTQDQKEILETMPSLKTLLATYQFPGTQWQCPVDVIDPLHGTLDGRKPSWFEQDGSSYLFDDIDAISSVSLSAVGNSSVRLLATDEEPFHGGGDQEELESVSREGRVNAVFFDGHAKSYPPVTVQTYINLEGCWF